VLANLRHQRRALVHPADATGATAATEQVIRLVRAHEPWELAERAFRTVDLHLHTVRRTSELVEAQVQQLQDEIAKYGARPTKLQASGSAVGV